MRYDEIKNLDELQFSERGWLKLIALELAKLNEPKPEPPKPEVKVNDSKRHHK